MFKIQAATALPLLLCSFSVFAEWSLDEEQSSFYYVTSKASAISEVNSFAGLSGGISNEGVASLAIALATVDTAIEIRNERMSEIVFKVAEYPRALVSVGVETAMLDGMEQGASITGNYDAEISLHGITQTMGVDLQVLKTDADTLQVSLARPLIVNAASFGLAEGVEQLREIAGLPSINPNVVVDFTLVYNRQ